MDALEPVRLNVEISASDATEDELDELARRLLSELRDQDVESAELAKSGPAPAGSKSAEVITAGAIAMAVLPAALPKVIDFIQAWATRGQGRVVKFKGNMAGQPVDFEGSSEDLKTLIAALQKPARK